MSKKQLVIICLIIAAFLAAGCSSVSTGVQSVQEFFGFSRPTQESLPTTDSAQSGQKAQNTVNADEDPFSTGSNVSPQNSSDITENNWDDIDPALIEPDEPDLERKSESSVQNAWEDDPYAYSFSESTFAEGETEMQPKQIPAEKPQPAPGPAAGVPGTGWPVPEKPGPGIPSQQIQVPQNLRPTPTPFTFYRFHDHPVFRPMCELPRTGFPTGSSISIKSSVTYAKTNMSLSIPTLNVNENIVIVPLIEDNFPVDSLGNDIGLLEGSGPGPEDLFVLAGHNHLDTQEKGPFAALSALKESDLIFIQGANDASRTFVVYANEKFASNDIEGLLTYARPGCMILITCEDESIEGGYLNRRVVFAEAKED